MASPSAGNASVYDAPGRATRRIDATASLVAKARTQRPRVSDNIQEMEMHAATGGHLSIGGWKAVMSSWTTVEPAVRLASAHAFAVVGSETSV